MAKLPTSEKVEVAKILMQEYISARQEVLEHVKLYKTQGRSAAFLIPLTSLLIPLALGQQIQVPNTTISLDPNPWISLGVVFTISTVILHMTFSILAIQFATQVLAERCVYLENEINDCFEIKKPMVWERVSQQIWSNKSPIVFYNPDTFVIFFAFIIALFFAVFLPLYAVTRAFLLPHSGWFYLLVFGYVFYLFFAVLLAVHLTMYSTSSLRIDCRQIFGYELKKDPLPSRPAMRSLLIIASIAGAITSLFIICMYQQAQASVARIEGSEIRGAMPATRSFPIAGTSPAVTKRERG